MILGVLILGCHHPCALFSSRLPRKEAYLSSWDKVRPWVNSEWESGMYFFFTESKKRTETLPFEVICMKLLKRLK